MPPQKKVDPKYLFDLYGVVEVLSNGSNQARSAFIDGMASGSVRVMKNVSAQLKDVDEDLYSEFQDIKTGRVYQETGSQHWSAQQGLMDAFDTGLFGGSPTPDFFESVAVCKVEKLELVTAGKGLSNSKQIAKKCGLNGVAIHSVKEFGSLN